MTLALEIARRALAAAPLDPDGDAARAALAPVVDALGCALAGAGEPVTRALLATPGVADAAGPARVIATAARTSALDAALVNGTAAHALDYDDFTEAFGGHPTVPVLPAVLALGEARGASGTALLDAYVVGVEAETRIAAGVHFHHYEKGWHPTATLGVFGAAVGCARLLGLDARGGATAIAIAASSAAGVKANFGTGTKPLHVGRAAREGLLAALLARQGTSARLDVLEAPQGFLEVYNGAGRYDAGRMLDGWFDPPAVVEPGASLKQYPCCGSAHPPVYLAIRLRDEHALDPAAIARVEVRVHPRRLPHVDVPEPASALAAKFSLQYCVARALVDGRVGLEHFEGERHRDRAVRALVPRIEVAGDPSLDGFGASLAITLADGRRVEARVERMAGRGREHPMAWDEIEAKFRDCAGRVLDAARIDRAWRAARGVADVEDLRELGDALGT